MAHDAGPVATGAGPVGGHRDPTSRPPADAEAAEEQAETAPDARLHELLARYGVFLRRTIAKVCPRELGLAFEDIEQEARIGLWTALKSEREIAFPASYIYKVAVSATVRAIRRAKARREESLPDESSVPAVSSAEVARVSASPSPYVLAERQELRRQIEAGVAQLPANRRLAVRLHLQGLTTAEIGELSGWSEPKARNLVYRGLKDLRQYLRALGIEDGR